MINYRPFPPRPTQLREVEREDGQLRLKIRRREEQFAEGWLASR